jgi:hypothetical protein
MNGSKLKEKIKTPKIGHIVAKKKPRIGHIVARVGGSFKNGCKS